MTCKAIQKVRWYAKGRRRDFLSANGQIRQLTLYVDIRDEHIVSSEDAKMVAVGSRTSLKVGFKLRWRV